MMWRSVGKLSSLRQVRNLCETYSTRPRDNCIFKLSEEVKDAVHHGKPVVALESTIITHGMPYPQNIRMAKDVEQIVRENGAVPATIAILRGRIQVGLSTDELEYLADPSTSVIKTSRRDFPMVLSAGLNGGTTVSGTMVAANWAGISIFSTGGIGGVHRGVETTMDVSADLTELGRTPVTVVSSGVKSILDIARTLEYLETQGVCIASYGASKDFPAFFSPKSGYQAPYNVENPASAARMIDSHHKLGLENGILIAVPIPESEAAQGRQIEGAIQMAVSKAREAGVTGKEVTPFILQEVSDITQGASLKANIALAKNNAKVASQIACQLSSLRKSSPDGATNTGSDVITGNQHKRSRSQSQQPATKKGRVVVIGGSIVDFNARVNTEKIVANGGTFPGGVQQSFGGVGRNLADALSCLGVGPLFVSAIGADSHRTAYQAYCQHMDLSGVSVMEGHRTATYCAVLKSTGDVVFGIGDMDIHQTITPQVVSGYEDDISRAPMVCVDGNVPRETIQYVCEMCHGSKVPVWFEPTDIHKAGKPFGPGVTRLPTYVSPNLNELRQMYLAVTGVPEDYTERVGSDDLDLDAVLEESIWLSQAVTEKIPVVIVTLGKHGVLFCRNSDMAKLPTRGDNLMGKGQLVIDHYPAASVDKMPRTLVSVSGAGDCLNAGIISEILQGHDLDLCMKTGLLAAQLSLQSYKAVPAAVSPSNLTVSKVMAWAPWQPHRVHPGSGLKVTIS